MERTTKKPLRTFFFLLAVVTGFMLVVSSSVFYATNVINAGNACGCVIPLPILIFILSLMGFFVGAIVAFVFTNKIEKERTYCDKRIDNMKTNQYKNEKKIFSLLLPKDESKILNWIIDHSSDRNENIILQSEIEKKLNINRVKAHRIITKFSEIGIIDRIKEGKTFKLRYNPTRINKD